MAADTAVIGSDRSLPEADEALRCDRESGVVAETAPADAVTANTTMAVVMTAIAV